MALGGGRGSAPANALRGGWDSTWPRSQQGPARKGQQKVQGLSQMGWTGTWTPEPMSLGQSHCSAVRLDGVSFWLVVNSSLLIPAIKLMGVP